MGMYKVNSPAVVDDCIEDEVVVINLRRGTYYSLAGTGAKIWNLLKSETTFDALADEFASSYGGRSAAVEQALKEFLAALVREELIIGEVEGWEAAQGGVSSSSDLPFQKPLLEKFDDMREMLLSDPIHDVSEMGWPNKK